MAFTSATLVLVQKPASTLFSLFIIFSHSILLPHAIPLFCLFLALAQLLILFPNECTTQTLHHSAYTSFLVFKCVCCTFRWCFRCLIRFSLIFTASMFDMRTKNIRTVLKYIPWAWLIDSTNPPWSNSTTFLYYDWRHFLFSVQP